MERSTFRVRVHPLSNELGILYFISLYCWDSQRTEELWELWLIQNEGFVTLNRVISRNDYDSHDPEIRICSLRTITIFFPCKSCFATIEASRPSRWPLPSTTTTSAMLPNNMVANFSPGCCEWCDDFCSYCWRGGGRIPDPVQTIRLYQVHVPYLGQTKPRRTPWLPICQMDEFICQMWFVSSTHFFCRSFRKIVLNWKKWVQMFWQW